MLYILTIFDSSVSESRIVTSQLSILETSSAIPLPVAITSSIFFPVITLTTDFSN